MNPPRASIPAVNVLPVVNYLAPELVFRFWFREWNVVAHRESHAHERELVLIHLCYTGISSFAGDLINAVICLEETSNSTCVTSVAGLCLRIRVAHNQVALCISGVVSG